MKNKNESKILFVCNTVYQVLVALWIAHIHYRDDKVDFFISDHMNGAEDIAYRIDNLNGRFRGEYIKTRDYCGFKIGQQYDSWYYKIFPEKALNVFVNIKSVYQVVYIANFDRFSFLLVNSLGHKCYKKPDIILFEDGISTYSKIQEYYEYYKEYYRRKYYYRRKIPYVFFRGYPFYGNIKYALVFDPEIMMWSPSENRKLEKINFDEMGFLSIINYVFDYKNDAEEYNKTYIFMEESFFADGKQINDIEIVEELAKRVGKDNIMVKIHPRNPINRFNELGYKTNSNTSIPWELICLNMKGLEDRILLTISSQSILTPIMLFEKNIKAYSLGLLTKGAVKKNPAWQFTKSVYSSYSDNITLCNSLDEIPVL